MSFVLTEAQALSIIFEQGNICGECNAVLTRGCQNCEFDIGGLMVHGDDACQCVYCGTWGDEIAAGIAGCAECSGLPE